MRGYGVHRGLHSSPTRRSSDLGVPTVVTVAVAVVVALFLLGLRRNGGSGLRGRGGRCPGDGNRRRRGRGGHIGRAHVCTPVTERARLPSSPCTKKLRVN